MAASVLFTLLIALALAGPAHAAFPGANGKIYLTQGPPAHAYSLNSDGTGFTDLLPESNSQNTPHGNADGTKIALTRFVGGLEVYSMNADSTGLTQLTTGSGATTQALDWSPDGTKIVYTRFDGLGLVNADGTGQTTLGEGAQPAWSPDGTKIAYASSGQIKTKNADGTGITQLTSLSGGSADAPDWSPDGSKITFSFRTNGMPGLSQIYAMNADGTGQANLTNNTVNSYGPLWAPNGTKIAYATSAGISTMNPDGTGDTLLYSGSALLPTDWAPTALQPPTVTAISPTSGPTTGGTVVTLTGTHLAGATAITFGAGNNGTALSCTATSCTVTSPAHAAGTVDVQVTTPGGTSATSAADQFTYLASTADIDVNLEAQPNVGILVPYLRYTLTARNTGPDAVTSATLSAALPPGAGATNLSSGCTAAGTTVTCTYGPIANGASVDKTFRVPLSLLSLGNVTVTATRTTSAPTDPNPANDNASAGCTVVSIILVTCP